MLSSECVSTGKLKNTLTAVRIKLTTLMYIYRGYYTEVRRYEFYLRVVKTIFYERAQRVCKILFSQREIVFEKRFHHVYYIVVNNLKPKSVILIFDQ